MPVLEPDFIPNEPKISPTPGKSTAIIEKNETNNLFGNPYNVILFNDNHNSFEDVMRQVIKAIKCTPEIAYNITLEAHEKGESIVFTGSKERCELIDSILSGPPTRLATDIRPA